MRARHLKALKSPFVDKFGEPLWDGNVVNTSTGLFSFFGAREVKFERGTWYLIDLFGIFIDNSNRYTPLNAAIARNYQVTDSTVRLK